MDSSDEDDVVAYYFRRRKKEKRCWVHVYLEKEYLLQTIRSSKGAPANRI